MAGAGQAAKVELVLWQGRLLLLLLTVLKKVDLNLPPIRSCKYRELKLNFTAEMEVLHMLYERCHTKNRMRSLKPHLKYFNLRGKI